MTELILLVVAAAWLAVLIPPMLRSRVENRPNSSVTDFRRQLTKLQHTATPPRGAVRAMGRPLAQSPLSRPVAGGRPAQPTLRSGVTRQPSKSEIAARGTTSTMPARPSDPIGDAPRFRSHGDSSGGQRRPAAREHRRGQHERDERAGAFRRPQQVPRDEQRFADDPATPARRTHGDATGERRRPSTPARQRSATPASRQPAKQRRSNVLFVLAITTACALFLAVTTGSAVMWYGFVLALLALSGFVFMLTQSRQRAQAAPYDDWLD